MLTTPYQYQLDGPKQLAKFRLRGILAVSCQQSYADKKGKYNQQAGLTIPKVD